jgi:hypothetical protein
VVKAMRDDRWSEAIAVGSLGFVETVKGQLGVKGLHRAFEQVAGAYALRERSDAYGGEFTRENDVLRLENTLFWDENAETAEAWRGPTPWRKYRADATKKRVLCNFVYACVNEWIDFIQKVDNCATRNLL